MRSLFAFMVCLGVVGVIVVGFFIVREEQTGEDTLTEPVSLVATIYPLQYITARLAHGIASVGTVVPAGVEPHDFEPRPTDVARILRAPLVVANGAELDGWIEPLESDIQKEGHRLFTFAEEVPFLPLAEEEDHEEGEESEHGHGSFDPHAWLDPVRMQEATRHIASHLSAIYPNLTTTIQENTSLLLADLESLDAAYASGLSSCKTRTIVVSHNAFGYIADRYNLFVVPLTGMSPHEEPSAGRLAEITTFAKKEGISTIFFETLVSPKVAETVAKEAGVVTAVLNPIEGRTPADEAEGKEYIDFMMDNLQALEKALVCA
jgi:zinc transport system substrate-binding protein